MDWYLDYVATYEASFKVVNFIPKSTYSCTYKIPIINRYNCITKAYKNADISYKF